MLQMVYSINFNYFLQLYNAGNNNTNPSLKQTVINKTSFLECAWLFCGKGWTRSSSRMHGSEFDNAIYGIKI